MVEAARRIGLRVIEETERFTLLGADARRGKLTLFDAEGPRERGALKRIGLRVASGGGETIDLGEGIEVALVDAPTTHAVFVYGPERVRIEYVEHKATFSL